MATQKTVTGRQANKLANDPKVRAAVLAALQASGEIPSMQTPAPPVHVEAEDEDDTEEDEQMDAELLAATNAEREGRGLRDPGQASAPQVGDVPDAEAGPRKDAETPDRNDAKDQTPAVARYHVVSDSGDDKERYKLLRGQIQLTNDDRKLARKTAHDYIEHEFGKGGRSELAAALQKKQATMTQTGFQFCLRAANNSFIVLRDAAGELVMDEVTEKPKNIPGENFLAWFDALVDYAEEQCRKEYREKHKSGGDATMADLQPAKVIFGDHWTVLKSQLRRSIKGGLNPWDFENGGAYIQAGKPQRKKAGAAGQTNAGQTNGRQAVNADNPILAPVLDDRLSAMSPALGAALGTLVKVCAKVGELHATEVGQMVFNLAKDIEAKYALVKGADPAKEQQDALRQDAGDKGAGVVTKVAA
jgi:hypothetical protein